MKRFQLLMMFLFKTTKTAVFLKTTTVEPELTRPACTPVHSIATGTQICKRSSESGQIFNGPQTIPRVSAVFVLVNISKCF